MEDEGDLWSELVHMGKLRVVLVGVDLYIVRCFYEQPADFMKRLRLCSNGVVKDFTEGIETSVPVALRNDSRGRCILREPRGGA